MNNLWLVYTDEAGVIETAGVYSTSEKAVVVKAEAELVSAMPWYVRMLPPIDSDWEI